MIQVEEPMMEIEMAKQPKARIGVRCDDELLDLLKRTRTLARAAEGETPTRSVIMRRALRIGLLHLLESEHQESLRF